MSIFFADTLAISVKLPKSMLNRLNYVQLTKMPSFSNSTIYTRLILCESVNIWCKNMHTNINIPFNVRYYLLSDDSFLEMVHQEQSSFKNLCSVIFNFKIIPECKQPRFDGRVHIYQWGSYQIDVFVSHMCV